MLNDARHFDPSDAARVMHFRAWGVVLGWWLVVAALFSSVFHRGCLMRRTAYRGPALLIAGLLLLAYSTLALAQQAPPNYGPDWSVIATAAVGVVTLLVGAYAKGLDGRVGRAEVQISELHRLVLSNYHSKPDIERAINSTATLLRTEMSAIRDMQGQLYGELQRIRGPHA